jgi:hypothetical protein
VDVKDWLAFAINAAAATVLFVMAFRLRNRVSFYVGLAFSATCVVMGMATSTLRLTGSRWVTPSAWVRARRVISP